MRIITVLLLLATILLSGCTGYRIEASTTPAPGPTVPSARGSIVLASTDVRVNGTKPATDDDVRKHVLTTLQRYGYQTILMPWDDVDPRTPTIAVTAHYQIDPNESRNKLNAMFIGLSLFLLAPFIDLHTWSTVELRVTVTGSRGSQTAQASSTGHGTFKILAPAEAFGDAMIGTITEEALRSCLQRVAP